MRYEFTPRDIERFWSKVDRAGECWLWLDAPARGGYGRISIGGRDGHTFTSSRIAWELVNGPVPSERRIRNMCGNRLCCRPEHYKLSDDPATRFWSKVNRSSDPDGCWLWTGSINPDGYGMFGAAPYGAVSPATGRGAHRVSWEMAFGAIPEGMAICHRCDNPRCVRPDHLFFGTPADNAADRSRKGRSFRASQNQGTKNGRAKLTEQDVQEIRRLHREHRWPTKDIAGHFGISDRSIHAVITKKSWKHM